MCLAQSLFGRRESGFHGSMEWFRAAFRPEEPRLIGDPTVISVDSITCQEYRVHGTNDPDKAISHALGRVTNSCVNGNT